MSAESVILERVNETRDVVVRMDARQEALAKQANEHHTTLYGNGREGLVSRMQTLEESRKVVYWALGVAGTAAGTIAGALLTLLWSWMKG